MRLAFFSLMLGLSACNAQPAPSSGAQSSAPETAAFSGTCEKLDAPPFIDDNGICQTRAGYSYKNGYHLYVFFSSKGIPVSFFGSYVEQDASDIYSAYISSINVGGQIIPAQGKCSTKIMPWGMILACYAIDATGLIYASRFNVVKPAMK